MTTSPPIKTNNSLIQSLDDLRTYLVIALQIEHATIPPYLTALYSIQPGSNSEAVEVIRSVAVEEMLHLTLVANVLNAIGGQMRHTLTASGFIPTYPAYLPTGEREFEVGLRRFCPETIETFMKIERMQDESDDVPLVVSRTHRCVGELPGSGEGKQSFYSIGLFYAEVIRRLYELTQELGEKAVFCGDPAKQITPEYYYNGAGKVIVVNDFDSANRALRMIQEQGEGAPRGHRIYAGSDVGEFALAHYFRFQQLNLGRYYQTLVPGVSEADVPNQPTGPAFAGSQLDWSAVYPIKPDLRLSDLPEGSDVREKGLGFQKEYSRFLLELERAFDGAPELLIPAVGGMFRLRNLAEELVRTPIPGQEHYHAAPLYKLD
ncbi:MAG: ferritin-like protein [Cyanobacteriota bacterium]|nr:ferritin-like protein [Cyanobacteriota bacterium]